MMAGKFQNNLDTWNTNLMEDFKELESELITEGYSVKIELSEMELPIQTSISNWKVTLSFVGFLLLLFVLTGMMERFFTTLISHRLAYAYIFPAMFGVFLLVFFPFIYGILIGFTDYNLTNFGGDLIEYFSNFKNYGFDNFVNILKVVNFKDYDNFYFTLVHTILWTVLNLVLHVGIGVILALILNDARLKGRTFFRILLILPWAIPNYITALIWRGMFHKQFGAINGLLGLLGIQSISWFTAPLTAFLANLATNVWLGFPFMMIIALGALQSIPKELYEASAIDGSSKWQSFWNVTFPLLKPAMVPAIILGTIWTFNQFNVIYLVSGGGPDGATELLITDAYKLAFEQYRYGYAAAYCIIIFLVLLTYGLVTSKVTRATKGVYE
jgi:arabinogalactan oligomer/maltooligosaccharide transport system permease protein